eukprot:GHVL01042247.1.p1 GENE.GHVL01042247.1~~GHVL01042247.1.p1  ORF type:complete len:389 (-),score=51.61 GHVL01042247.1:2232-3398(-)
MISKMGNYESSSTDHESLVCDPACSSTATVHTPSFLGGFFLDGMVDQDNIIDGPLWQSFSNITSVLNNHSAPTVAVKDSPCNQFETAPQEARTRRLARNRESAKKSRKRKKLYAELMEQKIAKLMEEIKRLKSCAGPAHKLDGLDADSEENRAELMNFMKQGASDKELQILLEKLLVRVGANGAERRKAVDFHLSQLQDLFIPPVNRLLYSLAEAKAGPFRDNYRSNISASLKEQPTASTNTSLPLSSESCPNFDANGLVNLLNSPSSPHLVTVQQDESWSTLCNKMNLNDQQTDKLSRVGRLIQREREYACNCLKQVEILKRWLAIRAFNMQKLIEKTNSILSPRQSVMVFDWLICQSKDNSIRTSVPKLGEADMNAKEFNTIDSTD